jgi:hypothetical protein
VAIAAQNGVSWVYKVNGVYVISATLGWASKNPNHYAASYVPVTEIMLPFTQTPGADAANAPVCA